jgi:hypothetical protein
MTIPAFPATRREYEQSAPVAIPLMVPMALAHELAVAAGLPAVGFLSDPIPDNAWHTTAFLAYLLHLGLDAYQRGTRLPREEEAQVKA